MSVSKETCMWYAAMLIWVILAVCGHSALIASFNYWIRFGVLLVYICIYPYILLQYRIMFGKVLTIICVADSSCCEITCIHCSSCFIGLEKVLVVL